MSHLCFGYSNRIVQSVLIAPLFLCLSKNKMKLPDLLIRNLKNCIKRWNNSRTSKSIRNNTPVLSGNAESKFDSFLLLLYPKMNKGVKNEFLIKEDGLE